MYQHLPSAEETRVAAPALPLAGGVVLVMLALALFWLGVFPTPLLEVIRSAVSGLL
jgi:NADH:ubiquinone oxidoreductase subunit 4 (subunit M)